MKIDVPSLFIYGIERIDIKQHKSGGSTYFLPKKQCAATTRLSALFIMVYIK